MDDNKVLTIFTKALLDRRLDFDVTLNGSEVRVRVFDGITNDTVGIDTSDSVESALAGVLAGVAKGSIRKFNGLSKL